MKDFKYNIEIPRDPKYIIDTIYENGYEAFVVGGCVRDSILKKKPKDWDITTSGSPNKIIKIFKENGFRVIETGLKHGTVTVIINNEAFEVTTYRIEGKYEDNRRPSKVEFTGSIKEDLQRRDFTINAMAYNHKEGLKDFFSGINDLKSRKIKCVGDANTRFNEDALRMMRGIRFSSQLGFDIEESTFQAMINNAYLIENISKERIKEEFSKTLISSEPIKGIINMKDSTLLKYILPEIWQMIGFNQKSKYHDKDIFDHTLMVVNNVKSKLHLRLAALLHDIGKINTFTLDENGEGHFYGHEKEGGYIAEEILKRLKFDNKTIDKVRILVREHMNRNEGMKDKTLKKLIKRVGKDNLNDLFDLQISDILSSAPDYRDYKNVIEIKRRCDRIIKNKEPLCVKDLSITGKDLMDIGVAPGKQIGEILNFLLEIVMERPDKNNKEELFSIVKKEFLCKDQNK